MQIKQITDNNFREKWNSFVIKNSSPASFLQSWEWGDFCENKVFRFGVFEDEELIAVAHFIQKKIFKNKFYLNCPKGPIVKFPNHNFQFPNKFQISNFKFQNKILELVANEIKKIAKQEKIIFFRIAPVNNIDNKFLKNNNFIQPKILTNLIEPENTLILDLEKSKDELLKAMHQKTRYNIKLAERKGVKIKQEKNINIFYNLIKETAKRDKINIFNKNYYENLLNNKNLNITQFIAEYNNNFLASIININYGDTVTYFYGASSNEKRNLMPNYLIQWEAIKWAKKNGYKYYDFWGINENNWAGITRFKKGFSGKEINFIGAFDYVLNKKWYNIFRIGRFLKNII